MPKTVILVGMIEPYTDPVDDDTEIWVINRAYTQQTNPKADKIYFFDSVNAFSDGFIDGINDAKIPAITRRRYEEIPLSEPYPYDEVVEYFNGIEYFACTASYMIPHAVMLGAETIRLHGMYWTHDSTEYVHHKPCMEFWIGVAMGRGVHMIIDGDTQLCRPYPWSSKKYGYVYQQNEGLAIQTISCSYRACLAYPVKFVSAEVMDKKAGDRSKEISNVIVGSATDALVAQGNVEVVSE
jgi:hypothetical protein